MPRTFARDDVLRLAPDASSAKSGQDLAQPRKWSELGIDEGALWGLCQGSGSKPYQAQVDLSEPAFKCSCPSRKFPCKHGLGLLLIYATSPDAVAKAQRPQWVDEWMKSREVRAAKAAEKQSRADEPPRDPEAQAKRRAQRLSRAQSGMRDLAAWTRDLIHSGIGAAPTKGFEFFDGQARRMVDAQAPGVARMVRQLGSLAASGAGWQRPFAEGLAMVHLTARAVENLNQLPAPVQADVQSVLGIPVASEDLATLPALHDQWQVVAQEIEIEDKLRAQRTWLFGVESRRTAFILQFAHGTAALDTRFTLGTQIEADLGFYPGNALRADIRTDQTTSSPIQQPHGYDSLGDALDAYSTIIASCPWIDRLCLPLLQITPTSSGKDNWLSIDSRGQALPMTVRGLAGYTMLAMSGGAPVTIAAEFDGHVLRPLSVAAAGQWISLCAEHAEVSS